MINFIAWKDAKWPFSWLRITCSKKYKRLPCWRGLCAPSGQEIMRWPAWKNKTLLRAASRHKPPAHLINCAVNWIPRVCGQTQTTREHVAEQEPPPVRPCLSNICVMKTPRVYSRRGLEISARWTRETSPPVCVFFLFCFVKWVWAPRATSWSSIFSGVTAPGLQTAPKWSHFAPKIWDSASTFSIQSHVCDSKLSLFCLQSSLRG